MIQDREKDQINWLLNNTDARKLLDIINPRDFTVVEVVILHNADVEEVLDQNTSMVQYKEQTEQMLAWMDKMNEKHGHNPGEKYIYFRFKRWN